MKSGNYVDVICPICKGRYKVDQSKLTQQEPYYYDLYEENYFSEFMFKLEMETAHSERYCSSCLEKMNDLEFAESFKRKTIYKPLRNNRQAKNREVNDY